MVVGSFTLLLGITNLFQIHGKARIEEIERLV